MSCIISEEKEEKSEEESEEEEKEGIYTDLRVNDVKYMTLPEAPFAPILSRFIGKRSYNLQQGDKNHIIEIMDTDDGHEVQIDDTSFYTR